MTPPTPVPTEPRLRHPRALHPGTLALTLVLSVVGAIIGMQTLTTLGITPNTSIIGVLFAIGISRVPGLRAFRSTHRQNLLQTNISSATFGAANSLLLPIGIPVLLGRPDLVPAMLIGATIGMLINLAMLYWFFDSRIFPGAGPWPQGVAAAEAIRGAQEGGRRAAVLGVGALGGVAGSSAGFGMLAPLVGPIGVPMSAFGVAFLGHAGALTLFGVGLLLRGYSTALTGIDLNQHYIPHGVMLGAGLVALVQAVRLVTRARGETAMEATAASPRGGYTRSDRDVRLSLARGVVLYLAAALLLAVLGGLYNAMPPLQLAGWVLFAAFACIAAEFIVGFSAMQAGWFPAFSTALIFLLIGLILGFPPEAAALLVGFVAAGSPAFADAGYDFKAGWQLRGRGADSAFELEGRREQLVASLVGMAIAFVLVVLFHDLYFSRDLFPPIDRVFAATIESGIDPSIVGSLPLWAVPGALLQLAGGAGRQLGILFGTGLLILNPMAGWAVLAGIAIRLVLLRSGRASPEAAAVFGAGAIAGDALWAFGSSVVRAW